MVFVKPSFFDDFFCTASNCDHTCCVGWEIDVDEETKSLYRTLPGELGQEMRDNITEEPNAHFILRDGERCPFLRSDGLCRIILEFGEDALCEICREHPRFYNCFPGREEKGLGLCCEEVVRLLLSADRFELLYDDDGAREENDPWREKLAEMRKGMLDIMGNRNETFQNRLEAVFRRIDEQAPIFQPSWTEFFFRLERMDENWTKALEMLRKKSDLNLEETLKDTRYEKIFSYLLYRHLITATDMQSVRELLFFCAVGTILISALDRVDPENRDEHIRLFSAEIEYSDENITKICQMNGTCV